MHAAAAVADLPEWTGVRQVWFSDWYDGPVTGIAVHEGREYWFVMVIDDGDVEPRVHVAHRLSDEQLRQAWEMHRDFAAVGLPGCLHSPPCAVTGTASAEVLAALRDRWPPEAEDDYANAPAVGWFRQALPQRAL